MKYSVKKLDQNRWAVFTGKRYFPNTASHSKRKVTIEALYMSASWHQKQMDKIHDKLEKLGVIDFSDPKGYLA